MCARKSRASNESWLAQANYIFNQLKITSNHHKYIPYSHFQLITEFVQSVGFHLEIGTTTQNPPDAYLFLCSPEDFRTGPTSFRQPNCPAYWSLDPSGSDPLSQEEASSLGFPSIKLRTTVNALRWDETVYAGLRKFDQCKGFDPEIQDIAKELGYPLYEICVPGKCMQMSRRLQWY
ncbi:hypothetical protein C8R45DRAFT_834851 [Mycena sanguinolenta]|nr:hypothetical protein C8R45DRAFT_834851 [Mycena sanguinolenta]